MKGERKLGEFDSHVFVAGKSVDEGFLYTRMWAIDKDMKSIKNFHRHLRKKLGSRDVNGNLVVSSDDYFVVHQIDEFTLLFHSDGLAEILYGIECVFWDIVDD